MNIADAKAAVRRWIDAVNTNDVETFLAAMTPDIRYEVMGTSVLSGTYDAAALKDIAALMYGSSDTGIRWQIVSMTAEDDRVAVEFIGTGRMVTGDRYDNVYHTLFRVRDGKVCEIKEYTDTVLVNEVFTPILQRIEEGAQ
jgi:ketosteroid isomerase-like protein